MPTFYLDDQPIEFEPGEKVLQAALRAGVEIPHYCFHPALSIVATCRMCLVDIIDMGNGRPSPKLQTSCSTDAAEGMKILTKNDSVKASRELVMEFLLVNHPLDCPICDQAGECTLQDYSYEYGSGRSEMEYSKRVYGQRDIGTFVTLERNRCIHCTRCERFTNEITGTHEFGLFNRGHELTVDTFADRPMVNKFQGNMADICPVGCITEKEFRFKKRVWNLEKTNSICTGCSTGCNITIEQHRNTIHRFKPRENQDVNKWWMCDDGRLTYRKLNERESRLVNPMAKIKGKLQVADWEDLYDALQASLQQIAAKEEEIIAITDTHATNEELYLLKQFVSQALGSNNVFFPKRNWSQPQTDYFIDTLITTDSTPNQSGALTLDLQGDESDNNLKQVLSQVKVLVVMGNPYENDISIQEKALQAELIIYIGSNRNQWSEKADVIFAGRTSAEKKGTFTNKNRRIQKIHPALKAPTDTKPEWAILAELLDRFGKKVSFDSIEDVFNEIGENVEAFKGIRYESIDDFGYQLPTL